MHSQSWRQASNDFNPSLNIIIIMMMIIINTAGVTFWHKMYEVYEKHLILSRCFCLLSLRNLASTLSHPGENITKTSNTCARLKGKFVYRVAKEM